MNKILLFAAVIVFIFLITYKPGSGTVEKYLVGVPEPKYSGPVARGPVCDQSRYHDLQFGDVPPGRCDGLPKEFLGAVIEA